MEAPGGFLAGLADCGLDQGFAIFEMPRRLIQHEAAGDPFLDHEKAAVTRHDDGDRDFGIPAHG